jgi:glycosyltransferase involved in cell wall biosynthesis
VVGEGPLDDSLRQLAMQLDISHHVVFTGFRADIPDLTAALDLSVLPSAFEGMGRVVLEAMAAGKPMVASRVGGIPDLVDEDVNGFLVPPNDVEPLASAIERLLKDDRLRASMSAAAARSVKHEHSSDAMVEQIHAFYDELSV